METRIGIIGIAGRMGRLLTEEVAAAGAKLAGGIDAPGATLPGDAGAFADIAALAASSDVVVEFAHASAIASHAAGCRKKSRVRMLSIMTASWRTSSPPR